MDYPEFQAQGLPIGSGMVESGNKLVVEVRLKGAGMHWERANVDPMLGLRNMICSDRWSQEWPRIVDQLRQEARERRKELHQKRRLAKVPDAVQPVILPAEVEKIELPEVIEKCSDQQSVIPKPSGVRRPAANHPWRHSSIGRALYQPANSAKN